MAKVSVGTACISNDDESVPPGDVACARGSAFSTVNGHFGNAFASGAAIVWKSGYHVSGTRTPVMAIGRAVPVDHHHDLGRDLGVPLEPRLRARRARCSSAANRMTMIDRFGWPPAALIRRIASMLGAKPLPSSTPPVAPLKQSKCPPMTTYSSG